MISSYLKCFVFTFSGAMIGWSSLSLAQQDLLAPPSVPQGEIIQMQVPLSGLMTSGESQPGLPAPVSGNVPSMVPSGDGGMSSSQTDALAPEQIILQQVAQDMKLELERLDKLSDGLPSLFFNTSEQIYLQDAIAKYEERDFGSENKDLSIDEINSFDFTREITLGGIVMHSPDDWILWLNKQRLTPSRLPPEIKFIRVFKDYVEIKWYDQQNEKTVPIRLRPNQRFNLDTQEFLPG